MIRKATLFAMLWVLFAAALPARAVTTPLPMDEAFIPSVARDGNGAAVVTWRIAAGYYLYRDLISAEGDDGEPLTVTTEPGRIKDDPGFGTTEVYYDSASASIAVVPETIRITYQGCQDGGLCYPPTTKTIDMAMMTISGTGGGFTRPQWSETSFAAQTTISAENGFSIASDHADTAVDRLLSDGGLALLITGFLGFGVLLAFTPCVFPMYPIVAAMLSREGERLTAARGFILASAYVLALSAAFGLLGMAAAWSGQNLQIALQSPWAIGSVTGLFIILALANFGLFHIQVPAVIANRFNSGGRAGGSIGGAALLGFSSAFLIGPCVTAPLAGALLYIARTGDVAIGALALFALGLGKGIPLIAMATIGGKALPRAGAWMDTVRHIFGFLFLATAVWIATPLIPDRFALLPWAILAITFGIYTNAPDRARRSSGYGVLVKSAALVSVLWGALLLVGFGIGANDPLTPLAPLRGTVIASQTLSIEKTDFAAVGSAKKLSAILAAAQSDRAPTMLYVTAEWCVTCRTIERSVLTASEVATALDGVRLASLDVTSMDSENSALMKSLGVVGPPTMIFFDAGKQEASGSRLVGEITAAALADSAKIVKAAR